MNRQRSEVWMLARLKWPSSQAANIPGAGDGMQEIGMSSQPLASQTNEVQSNEGILSSSWLMQDERKKEESRCSCLSQARKDIGERGQGSAGREGGIEPHWGGPTQGQGGVIQALGNNTGRTSIRRQVICRQGAKSVESLIICFSLMQDSVLA